MSETIGEYISDSSDSTNENQKSNKTTQTYVNTVKKKRKNVTSVCLTNCRYDVIRKTISKFGYKDVNENDNWNLYWTDLSISIERCKEMKRFQKINHFPGMLEICRKDLLARNLNRMQRLFTKDYSFFPKTWCLPADLGEALSYSRLRKNKTYILKPDAGSQGRGILITKSLKDIKPSDRVICQVYISRPFLIDGYKFDLRVYTLITSVDPLRIYVYKEGLVRFATSRYKEPTGVNISNVFMHLTNYAVNKHSRTYNQDEEGGSKRKLTWFNSFMRSMGHDVDRLWKNIDEVLIKTIVCAWPILKHSYNACFPHHDVIPACSELLGMDIILDRRLNPQILEVNHSPSFHTDTPLDCEVKEALLHDMIAMMNLDRCDKRKIMKEDRKRVRERLLQSTNSNINSKDNTNSSMDNNKLFADYYKHESVNKGGFRLIYPSGDKHYEKFLHQGQSSLYCDTAASRARETAQTAIRDEMQLKAKLDAAKRMPSRCKLIENSKLREPSTIRKTMPFIPITTNSFEPQMIVESEEKERLQRLAQRDFLVRSFGLLEHIYHSMKANGTLRPQDEKKYSLLEKMKINVNSSNVNGKGPNITDFMEGIKGENAKLNQRNDIPNDWGITRTHVARTLSNVSKLTSNFKRSKSILEPK